MSTAVRYEPVRIAPPPAWLLATACAAVYLLLAPPSADLAAQEYRAGLFEDGGFGLWNSGWYGGHHTPSYSVLFPPLGALLGVRLAGALAAVAAAALFARLALTHWGGRARWGVAWFAAGTLPLLLTGRMTYVLGLAAGLGALAALQAGHRPAAVGLAALTPLASPVAGIFLALAATAWGLGERRRRVWAAGIVAAALAPALLLAALFPAGGAHAFVPSAFWPALGAIAVLCLALPRAERTLRRAAALYAAGCVAAFAVSTPLGGNATRLGELAAGPVALCALAGRRRPLALAALALPLALWQLSAPVREVAGSAGDPSAGAPYHAGLVRFLESRPGAGSFRVEIPFTANHWEAAHVAPHVPLARGWMRQLDREHGALFYEDALDPERYRAWLAEHAVRYVALPDVEPDRAARDEAALVRRGVPWLRPVWRDEHWRVYAVANPAPLMTGVPGRAGITAGGFELRTRRAGTATVRVRHSRWWSVRAGDACVEEAPGGMTRVRVRRPGTVRVNARLAPKRCSP